MALIDKRILSSLGYTVIICIGSLLENGTTKLVTANDNIISNEHNNWHTKEKDVIENSTLGIVFPRRGLTTGPPVTNFLELKSTYLWREEKAQNGDSNISDKQTQTGLSSTAIDDVFHKKVFPNIARSQKLKDNYVPDPSPLPLRGKCLDGDMTIEDEHPRKETLELYDAVNDMLEHITGLTQTSNDPEEIRMRAFIGERKSAFAVEVILKDRTHFWESSQVEDIPIDNSKDKENSDSSSSEYQTFKTYGRSSHEEEVSSEDIGSKIDIMEGSKLRLVCNVTGVPSYFVEWRRAANLSFPGGAFVVGGRSVLLDYVGREDAGTYSCTATTPSGFTHTSGVSIRVQYPPVVGVWARDTNDKSIEVGCLVEGRPRPTTAWYLNNTKISSDNCPSNVEIKSSALSSRFVLSVLSLRNVDSRDFAYYHCRAFSSIGVSRAYVMIHDGSGLLDMDRLEDMRPIKHPAPLENPRLSSFMLGMVPPLYIGLYIIAYLGCYKTSISGVGSHGRFGAGMELNDDMS